MALTGYRGPGTLAAAGRGHAPGSGWPTRRRPAAPWLARPPTRCTCGCTPGTRWPGRQRCARAGTCTCPRRSRTCGRPGGPPSGTRSARAPRLSSSWNSARWRRWSLATARVRLLAALAAGGLLRARAHRARHVDLVRDRAAHAAGALPGVDRPRGARSAAALAPVRLLRRERAAGSGAGHAVPVRVSGPVGQLTSRAKLAGRRAAATRPGARAGRARPTGRRRRDRRRPLPARRRGQAAGTPGRPATHSSRTVPNRASTAAKYMLVADRAWRGRAAEIGDQVGPDRIEVADLSCLPQQIGRAAAAWPGRPAARARPRTGATRPC